MISVISVTMTCHVGSLFYTTFRSDVMSEYMDVLAYNGSGIANREFFDGMESIIYILYIYVCVCVCGVMCGV